MRDFFFHGRPEQGLDVVAHHGGLGRHGRHQLELLDLGIDLDQGFLAHAGRLDLFLHLVDVGALFAFAEFLLDGLDLLVEVILALALFHLALDAAANALFDLQDVEFGFELAEQLFQALRNAEHFQNFLLLFELQGQMRGDGIGQTPGFLDAGQRGQHLGRNLLVELDVLIELRQHGAAHGLDLVVGPFFDRNQADIGDEQRRADPRCAARARAARLRPAPSPCRRAA